MRAYLSLSTKDDRTSMEVWSDGGWKTVNPTCFNWADYRVPISDKPNTDGLDVLYIEEPMRLKYSPPNMPVTIHGTGRLSSLDRFAETIPQVVLGRDASIDLQLTEGIWIRQATVADMETLSNTGMLDERLLAWLDTHLSKLHTVLSELTQLPHADRLRVFGSVKAGKELPGDVDVFADTEGLASEEIKEFSRNLISIARRYYGDLDPFLLVKGKLHSRNDDANGWTLAKNAADILAAGREGTPLQDISLVSRVLAAYRAGSPTDRNSPTTRSP